MKEYYDLIVVGAGPIGLTAASEVAKNGYNVLAIEKRKEIGYPNHCSGLVSPDFIARNKVPKKLIEKEIKGAELNCRNERMLFKDEKIHAFVINRTGFDQYLAEEAQKNGVKILKNTSFHKWNREKDSLVLTLNNGKEIKTHILIIASGALTSINKLFGFLNKPVEVIHTLQFDSNAKMKDDEIVYTFLDDEISHNWFSWIIPIGNGMAHIGIGTDKNENVVELMNTFLKKNPYLKDTKLDINKAVSWVIPIGIQKTIASDNIMIAGDAAMQIKPLSGGGLYTGTIGAKLAAETAIKTLKLQDYSMNILSEYPARVEKEIVPMIKQGLILRKIYRSMSDREKEMFIHSVNNEKAKGIILKAGDIDFPIHVAKELFKFIKNPLFSYFKDVALSLVNGKP
jgi:digeranylgeranylglycerophospholipid reductase